MKLILLLALFAFSTAFLLVNSFSTERNNLFPAAAIFLIMGGFLVSGPGVQIQQGQELSYTTVNNSTVVDQKTPVYETVQGPLPNIEFSNILGMLFMVMGAGYIVMASPGRFISILRN